LAADADGDIGFEQQLVCIFLGHGPGKGNLVAGADGGEIGDAIGEIEGGRHGRGGGSAAGEGRGEGCGEHECGHLRGVRLSHSPTSLHGAAVRIRGSGRVDSALCVGEGTIRRNRRRLRKVHGALRQMTFCKASRDKCENGQAG